VDHERVPRSTGWIFTSSIPLEALFRRGSRGLQTAAAGFFTIEERMRHA
jgi:hypothetical protein